MIEYDCHMHSEFSTDSHTPLHRQVQESISLGLQGICMTDHMDYEFPREQMDSDLIYEGNPFEFNWEKYKQELYQLQLKHPEFELMLGVECGLQTSPSVIRKNTGLTKDSDLDFVIGSLHLVDGKDPYYPHFWEGKNPSSCIRQYFEQLYENLLLFSEMDSLGHLDYIVRYAPENFSYSPLEYRDILEEILICLIRKDIALEMNSSGLKSTHQPNPHEEILSLYRELGGQALTIGSDAHKPEFVGFQFKQIESLLKKSGFSEYYIFKKRKPISKSL